VAGAAGIEPAASGFGDRRSGHLSYAPLVATAWHGHQVYLQGISACLEEAQDADGLAGRIRTSLPGTGSYDGLRGMSHICSSCRRSAVTVASSSGRGPSSAANQPEPDDLSRAQPPCPPPPGQLVHQVQPTAALVRRPCLPQPRQVRHVGVDLAAQHVGPQQPQGLWKALRRTQKSNCPADTTAASTIPASCVLGRSRRWGRR
jgi:hypothetical protein